MKIHAIQEQQRQWAEPLKCDPDRPTYARSLEENLFTELSELTKGEFLRADGAELHDRPGRPAKMRALGSSSALAVNFFDPWRRVSNTPFGDALGFEGLVSGLRFEYVCDSYPVGPRSPNLDVLMALTGGGSVAVESKFMEPYRRPGRKATMSSKYFPGVGSGLWTQAGLEGAQKVAESVSTGWAYLDVAQLLKHMLGLAHDGCARTLLYLWYDTADEDALAHREEIERFRAAVANEVVEFRSRTYQEAFSALTRSQEPVEGWAAYMKRRYFAD